LRIILGSKSPRRAEILKKLKIPFVQMASNFDETSIRFEKEPAKYASRLAEKKAESLASQFPEDLILTSDTVVYCDGKVYNKPSDEKEAIQFLSELSGKWHEVLTAVTAQKGSLFFTDVETTRVLFHPLKKDEIVSYVHTFSPLDMAGAYAIQEGGCLLIARMEGCFYNVMGLPINALKNVLLKMDIDIWDFLK
jgi:septum formation protein